MAGFALVCIQIVTSVMLKYYTRPLLVINLTKLTQKEADYSLSIEFYHWTIWKLNRQQDCTGFHGKGGREGGGYLVNTLQHTLEFKALIEKFTFLVKGGGGQFQTGPLQYRAYAPDKYYSLFCLSIYYNLFYLSIYL